MTKFKKYESYTDPLMLYVNFKEDFFDFIDNNLAEWSVSKLIKEYYMDYQFDSIRVLLDDRTETWKNKALDSIAEGTSDRVYNTAYRNWKEVEDNYMLFYELYNELIELNIR